MITTSNHNFVVCQAANKMVPLTTNKSKLFQKLWIYPAKSHSGGKLNQNTGNVYVGKKGAGPDVTPDVLVPTDADGNIMPLKYELPTGCEMCLADVLLQADNANDGVFYDYW